MKPFRVIYLSFRDFFRDGGIMHSAALSYFSMMALVPFCILIISLFGHIIGQDAEFFRFFVDKLVGVFPRITKEITDELRNIIAFRGLGKLSILIYAFLSYQLFSGIQAAFNKVFKIKEQNPFFINLFLSITIVTIMIAAIIASFALSSLIPFLRVFSRTQIWLEAGAITQFLVKFVVPFLLTLFISAIAYKILPPKKIRFSHALWGGLFTSCLLEIAKHVFTWYVGTVGSFGTIYGSLTAFVVFLLWVFYSFCIFLVGGEVVHNMGEMK